jgi:hypothetical protein
MREGTGPKSQRKEYNGVLLEMLISKEGKMSVSFSCRPSSSPGELLALPFYTLRGRIRLTTDPKRCLGGGGGASTVGVAMATCPGACRPSLGRRGDVDDGSAGHLGCCRGRVIPCGRRTGHGLFVRLMAIEAGSGRS